MSEKEEPKKPEEEEIPRAPSGLTGKPPPEGFDPSKTPEDVKKQQAEELAHRGEPSEEEPEPEE